MIRPQWEASGRRTAAAVSDMTEEELTQTISAEETRLQAARAQAKAVAGRVDEVSSELAFLDRKLSAKSHCVITQKDVQELKEAFTVDINDVFEAVHTTYAVRTAADMAAEAAAEEAAEEAEEAEEEGGHAESILHPEVEVLFQPPQKGAELVSCSFRVHEVCLLYTSPSPRDS